MYFIREKMHFRQIKRTKKKEIHNPSKYVGNSEIKLCVYVYIHKKFILDAFKNLQQFSIIKKRELILIVLVVVEYFSKAVINSHGS